MSEPFPPTVTGVGQTPTQPPPVIPTTTNMPSSTTAGAMPGTMYMSTTPGMTSTMPGSATMPMATDTLMTDPLDRKLILVCGGTGNQGGAVVNRLLSTGRYRVRVLTRDVNSIRARELVGRGVDVVAGDMSDLEALKKAMLGCYGVFSVQTPFRGHQTLCAEEIIHGSNVADAAKMCNIQHLVYSSVASADRAPKVAHFDSKWKIEQHIIALGVPYTILRPTYFMENFLMGPTQITRGKIPGFTSPQVKQYYVAVADIGVFAELAFSHPEDYLGRTIEIAGDRLDGRELTLLFDRLCPGYAPFKYAPISRTLLRVTNPEMYQMAKWMDDVGYKVDLLEVRRRNPYMRTVEQWATEQGFATRQLPAHAASACQLL